MNHILAKQTNARATRLLGGAVLSLLFMLLCGTASWGQESVASGAGVPPSMAITAAEIGVTAYNFDTWDDAVAAPKILAAMNTLQSKVADGSASAMQLLQYAYYSNIYDDMTKFDVGLEFAMLNRLLSSHTQVKSTVPVAQLPIVYSGLVSIL